MQQEQKFQDRAEYLQSRAQAGGFRHELKMKSSHRLRTELQHRGYHLKTPTNKTVSFPILNIQNKKQLKRTCTWRVEVS